MAIKTPINESTRLVNNVGAISANVWEGMLIILNKEIANKTKYKAITKTRAFNLHHNSYSLS